MKTINTFFLFILIFCTTELLDAQGYFVANAGEYINSSNFKTNSQKDISKYEGKYVAASETYESNYTFEVTTQGNSLNIKMISCGTMDGGEYWDCDTTYFKDVTIANGQFTLNFSNVIGFNDETAPIHNFRFVKCTYKQEGSSKNIKSEGIAWEEFSFFAERR